ncbi:MAG: hypothetical protein WC551_02165 [Patescibacteria group bacterium]
MPEQKPQVSAMTMLSVLFTLIAIVAIIALVMLKSKADTATEEVSVNAASPAVDTVTIVDQDTIPVDAAGLTPHEGDTNTVTVSGSVSDPNGCSDIDSVAVALYRTSVGLQEVMQQADNYAGTATVSGCTGGDDTTADYTVNIATTNFVNPTDPGSPFATDNWTVSVTSTDKTIGVGGLKGNNTLPFEVNSLSAFTTAESIDYGTVALGADSLEKTVTFTNTGNRAVDTTVRANNDMTEPTGNFAVIPVGNVHYAIGQNFVYGTADAAVSKTAAETFAIGLAKQSLNLPGNVPTVDTYWKLRMPTSGVNGTYSNTLTLTAVANP